MGAHSAVRVSISATLCCNSQSLSLCTCSLLLAVLSRGASIDMHVHLTKSVCKLTSPMGFECILIDGCATYDIGWLPAAAG